MKELNLLRNLTSMGVAALGAIAVTGFANAPAQATSLIGELEFDDGTTNFFEDVNPGAGDTFDVTFSPGGLAASFSATGAFAPFFPGTPDIFPVDPATATFEYAEDQTGSGDGFIYELVGDLNFDFDNGVSVSFGAGDQFLGAFDFVGGVANGVGFEEFGEVVGSVTIPGIDNAFLLAEELTFSDLAGGDSGSYGAEVQAAVPEPLTILGTTMALGFGTLFKKRRSSSAS